MITQQELKQLLNYDPKTGVFTKQGKQVGSTEPIGYITIYVKGKFYKAHRLAWLYVYGNIPKMLDHINQIKTDNRICNLRPATRSQNNANKYKKSNNTTGYKGVTKQKGKFRADICNKYLGLFDTAEAAAQAYDLKATELFGEYAKLNI